MLYVLVALAAVVVYEAVECVLFWRWSHFRHTVLWLGYQIDNRGCQTDNESCED